MHNEASVETVECREEPLTVTMAVPEGAGPGTKLQYKAPDGQELRLTVPEGVPPGSVLTLKQDPRTKAWKCMAEPADPEPEQPQFIQHEGMGSGLAYGLPPHHAQYLGHPPIMPGYPGQVHALVRAPLPVNLSFVPAPAPVPANGVPAETSRYPTHEAVQGFAPPGYAYEQQRPSYQPPPVARMQERQPSYTPIPQVIGGGPGFDTTHPGAAPTVGTPLHPGSSYVPPPPGPPNHGQVSYLPFAQLPGQGGLLHSAAVPLGQPAGGAVGPHMFAVPMQQPQLQNYGGFVQPLYQHQMVQMQRPMQGQPPTQQMAPQMSTAQMPTTLNATMSHRQAAAVLPSNMPAFGAPPVGYQPLNQRGPTYR